MEANAGDILALASIAYQVQFNPKHVYSDLCTVCMKAALIFLLTLLHDFERKKTYISRGTFLKTKITDKFERATKIFVSHKTLTPFKSLLSESWHPHHKSLSVTDKTFLVRKRPAVIPRDVIKAWYEFLSRPNPERFYAIYLLNKNDHIHSLK